MICNVCGEETGENFSPVKDKPNIILCMSCGDLLEEQLKDRKLEKMMNLGLL